MPMPLSQPKKIKIVWFVRYFKILILFLPLAIIIGGYLFLVRTEQRKYETEKALAESTRASLDIDIKRLVELKKIVDSYQDISASDREKINQILPDDFNESDLYVNIDGLIKETDQGLELEDISVKIIPPGKSAAQATGPTADNMDGLAEAEINLKLTGVNYINLKKLLSALEKNLRLFEVKSYRFNPEEEKLDLSMTTYYIK